MVSELSSRKSNAIAVYIHELSQFEGQQTFTSPASGQEPASAWRACPPKPVTCHVQPRALRRSDSGAEDIRADSSAWLEPEAQGDKAAEEGSSQRSMEVDASVEASSSGEHLNLLEPEQLSRGPASPSKHCQGHLRTGVSDITLCFVQRIT